MQVFSYGNGALNFAVYICPVDIELYVDLRYVLLKFLKKIIYIIFCSCETVPKSSHQIYSQSNNSLIFKLFYFVFYYMTIYYISKFKYSEGTYSWLGIKLQYFNFEILKTTLLYFYFIKHSSIARIYILFQVKLWVNYFICSYNEVYLFWMHYIQFSFALVCHIYASVILQSHIIKICANICK